MNTADFLRNSLTSHFELGTQLSKFSMFVALTRTVGTESTAGSEVTAGTGGYSRISWNQDSSTQPYVENSGTTLRNNGDIDFVSSGADWGVILGVEVYDALTGGNRLFFTSASTKTVTDGDTYRVPGSQLSIGFH
jgi:hypothetical protein